MKFFLPIIFLLGISGNVLGEGIRRERSNIEDELSYQELINMNISCYPWDSCTEDRTDDSPYPAFGGKCSCHSQCWEYGTCCIDSPYVFKPPTDECVYAGFHSYYMVHSCPDNTHSDSIWRSHCERELKKIDDILMVSPVTSLDTSRTYKNYYCFRCHETTDKYVSWNLEVSNFNGEAPKDASIYSVAYNQTERTWVAILNESHAPLPVSLRFNFPDNMLQTPREPRACNNLLMMTDCPRCADERLRAKCLAYMAVVYTRSNMIYKNVHCALCNDVSIDEILTCDLDPYSKTGSFSGSSTYKCLMNVNNKRKRKRRTCFKNEDIPETCKGVYDVWNRYSKVCQKISCPEPGDERKNDICVKS